MEGKRRREKRRWEGEIGKREGRREGWRIGKEEREGRRREGGGESRGEQGGKGKKVECK